MKQIYGHTTIHPTHPLSKNYGYAIGAIVLYSSTYM